MALIHTEIEINARPRYVWVLLSDFDRYSSWNPSVAQLEGELVPGARLRLKARLSFLTVRVEPVLIEAQRDRQLCWSATVLSSRWMTGEHHFSIEELSQDRIRLVQEERFTGWMGWIFALLFGSSLRRAYDKANQNVKIFAEQQERGAGILESVGREAQGANARKR